MIASRQSMRSGESIRRDAELALEREERSYEKLVLASDEFQCRVREVRSNGRRKSFLRRILTQWRGDNG